MLDVLRGRKDRPTMPLSDAAALDALDATIADADWPLIQALWRAG